MSIILYNYPQYSGTKCNQNLAEDLSQVDLCNLEKMKVTESTYLDNIICSSITTKKKLKKTYNVYTTKYRFTQFLKKNGLVLVSNNQLSKQNIDSSNKQMNNVDKYNRNRSNSLDSQLAKKISYSDKILECVILKSGEYIFTEINKIDKIVVKLITFVKIDSIYEYQKKININNYSKYYNYNGIIFDLCFKIDNTILLIDYYYVPFMKNNIAIFPCNSDLYFYKRTLLQKLDKIIQVKKIYPSIKCCIFFLIPRKDCQQLKINQEEKMNEFTLRLSKAIQLKINIIPFSAYFHEESCQIVFERFVKLSL